MPRSAPSLLLLAVLLAVLLAPRTAAAEDLEARIRELGGPDAKARSEAYRALVTSRDPRILPSLRRALPEMDDLGQWYGVLVLDRYPWTEAERSWRKLLEVDPPFLRLAAGLTLARHGDPGGADTAAVALATRDVDPAVRVRMLLRVGRRPPERVLVAMRGLLEVGLPLPVLTQMLTMLHDEQDRPAMGYVRRLLEDPRPGVRAMAAVYLYDLGELARGTDLAEALAAGVGYVEFGYVARVLSANRRVTDEILDALAAHLAAEANATLLVQQVDLLGRFQHRAARPALRALLTHPNATVARAAFDVLVTLSGPLREDTLVPLLRGDDVDRSLWAAEALRQRDDLSGIATVIYALQRGDVPQRRNAARILGTYANDLAVEPLLDALEDEHAAVRTAAHAALQRLFGVLFPYRTVALAAAGYAPEADDATRAEAVQRIRAWWSSNRGADW